MKVDGAGGGIGGKIHRDNVWHVILCGHAVRAEKTMIYLRRFEHRPCFGLAYRSFLRPEGQVFDGVSIFAH